MSFYMLDHSQHVKWTAGNFLKVAVVMHCTAGLDIADEVRRAGGEWAGVDNSAERTYEWSANTTTQSSWQSGSDWDSIIDGLPSGYIAWHVRGYNTYTIGHEISKTDMTWADEHEMWVGPTLLNAAIKVRQHCDKHNIPIRFIGKAQLDRAIAAKDPSMGGLTEHQLLDPDRRRDPGDDFPWERFLDLVRNPTGGLTMADIDNIMAELKTIKARTTPEALAKAAAKGAYRQRTNLGSLEASVDDWVTGKPMQMHDLVRHVRKDALDAAREAAEANAVVQELAKRQGITEADLAAVRTTVREALAEGVDIQITVDDDEPVG